MSTVHASRVLKELRERELISFTRGQLTVHNWDGLVELAAFRDDYLHLPPAERLEVMVSRAGA